MQLWFYFNKDFLVFAFVDLGVSNTIGSSVGSGVGILSRYFIENVLILILWRIISLALRNDLVLFRKECVLYQYLLLTDYPRSYRLEKTIGNGYFMKP